jgi:hypothetical protein
MADTTLTQSGAQVQADLNLLDSNSATQGQVLTANGTGGCAWANISGGGTQLYQHTISYVDESLPQTTTLVIISTSNADFASNQIAGVVYIKSFSKSDPVGGDNYNYFPVSAIKLSGNFNVTCITGFNSSGIRNSTRITFPSSGSTDSVIAL